LKSALLQRRETRGHDIRVVDQRGEEANAVAVRIHGKGQQGVKLWTEMVEDILATIRERRA